MLDASMLNARLELSSYLHGVVMTVESSNTLVYVALTDFAMFNLLILFASWGPRARLLIANGFDGVFDASDIGFGRYINTSTGVREYQAFQSVNRGIIGKFKRIMLSVNAFM
jgi:hypothetical protein